MSLWNENDIEDAVFNRKSTYELKKKFYNSEYDENKNCYLKEVKINCMHNKDRTVILDTCDEGYRFVIHPDFKIQTSHNGGIVTIKRIRAGEKINMEYSNTLKKTSIDFGVTISGNGLNVSSDNLSEQKFKEKVDDTTHEHLILQVKGGNNRYFNDKIICYIEYICIKIKDEKIVIDTISDIKRQHFLNVVNKYKKKMELMKLN